MPPYVRGGVWTNVEDEILRAAVAKYGMQQWSRVASLLVRKTARQCKARWTEWLSPTVRKTDWTAAEDEKLLHLARIMPNMWRSIAPMLSRTATQCLERYNYLLTGAADEGDDDDAIESRPARPDFVDMDDEEQEMLMEARARLANTKGKKAKRKERERFLDQQKREKTLEQRQLDKEQGKTPQALKLKKSKYSVDYNDEIPFEHPAPAGAHDTEAEKLENAMELDDFQGEIDAGEKVQFGKARKEAKQRKEKLPKPVVTPLDLPSPQPEPKPKAGSKTKLVGSFSKLPEPKNDFEIAPPASVVIPETKMSAQKDAETLLREKQHKLERRQATSVQKGLPVPLIVRGYGLVFQESEYVADHAYEAVLPDDEELARANALVDAETPDDSVKNPDKSTVRPAVVTDDPQSAAEAAVSSELVTYHRLLDRLNKATEDYNAETLRLAAFKSLVAFENEGIKERIADIKNAISNASIY